MPERHRYDEIAALVAAIDTPWFGRTLQGVLQSLFVYDHFLLAHYRRGECLKVLAHDLGGVETHRAIAWLESETYVAEPLFGLYAAGLLQDGVFDMADLVARAASLESPAASFDRLPHAVADTGEEIGYRTMGWPRHQQETCVIVGTGPRTLIAISLYNLLVEPDGPQSKRLLHALHPILAAVLVKHARSPAGRHAVAPASERGSHPGDAASASKPADAADVERFFIDRLDIRLTTRELDVFRALLNGATPTVIANDLGLSVATVRTHRRNVYRRLGHARLPELMNAYYLHLARRGQDRERA